MHDNQHYSDGTDHFDLMLRENQDFVNHVDKQILEQFVDSIKSQIDALHVQYEHLKGSNSLIHFKKVTHNHGTFRVFNKIVTDFYKAATREENPI